MRYFIIVDNSYAENKNVAVVFHDYVEGYYSCRSTKRSFYEAFNAVVSKLSVKLVKSSDRVYAFPFDAHDFDWMERVLFEACGGYWGISEKGEVSNSELAIDEVVLKFLQ